VWDLAFRVSRAAITDNADAKVRGKISHFSSLSVGWRLFGRFWKMQQCHSSIHSACDNSLMRRQELPVHCVEVDWSMWDCGRPLRANSL
jgi:hypothetical protein